jgi:hypothetical protein
MFFVEHCSHNPNLIGNFNIRRTRYLWHETPPRQVYLISSSSSLLLGNYEFVNAIEIFLGICKGTVEILAQLNRPQSDC